MTFVRPGKDAILAGGTKQNAAKLISTSNGEVLYDFAESQKSIGDHPIMVVDASHSGRIALIASADGSIFCKSILVGGLSADQDEDSDMSPMMTPKHEDANF